MKRNKLIQTFTVMLILTLFLNSCDGGFGPLDNPYDPQSSSFQGISIIQPWELSFSKPENHLKTYFFPDFNTPLALGVSTYKLTISEDKLFSTIYYESTPQLIPHFSFDQTSPVSGTYWAQISAWDETKEIAKTETLVFDILDMEIISPKPGNLSATGPLKIEWSKVDNAFYYELQYSQSSSFGTVLKEITSKTTHSMILPTGTWYFRVRAASPKGLMTDWSTSVKLNLTNNTPTGTIYGFSGKAHDTTGEISFSWLPSLGATDSISISFLPLAASVSQPIKVPASALSRTISSLSPGVEYTFTATPVSSNNSALGDPIKMSLTPGVPITGFYLSSKELALIKGNTHNLSTTVLPSNAYGSNVTWSSTSTAVATVNSNGLVTAKSPGRAVISATIGAGFTLKCVVWVKSYETGDFGEAGWVFYDSGSYFLADGVTNKGWRYLEASTYDLSDEYAFFPSGITFNSSTTSPTEVNIGAGETNSQAILAIQGTSASYAVRACLELNINGKDDWFLPSSEELKTLYQVWKIKGFSSFSKVPYWSSSEVLLNKSVRVVNFSNGEMSTLTTGVHSVRPIRAF